MSEDQPTTPAPTKRAARKRASDTATAADSVGKVPAKKAAKKAPKMAMVDDSTATKSATRTAAPAKTARKSATKKSAARKTPAKKAASKAARQSVAKQPAGHATGGGIGTIEASNAGKTVVNPAAAKAANETIATVPPAATASTPATRSSTTGNTDNTAPAKAATGGGTSKANGAGTNRVAGTTTNPATRTPDTAPARQRPATAPGTSVGNGVGNGANRGEHIRNGIPRTAHTPASGTAPGDFAATLRRWRQHAAPYLRLCRLDRPIGFLLLLWPTWWALWAAAEGFPPFGLLLIFTLGVIVMRSAGCVINDYADRWLDGEVKRTRNRPLPAGEVSPRQALALFGGLLLAALLLVLMTNPLTIKLSVIGAFLAASYPFLKRYTHLPQIWLGLAFGWAIPMAFAAVTGTVPKLAWLLFIANILWTTAYDTYYAMVDRDDDIRMGSKSTAILFGDMDLVAIAMLQGTFLLAMLFAGQQLHLGWPWTTALITAAALIAHQLWRTRHRERDACFKAFLDNNWVGMVLFVGLVVGLAVR